MKEKAVPARRLVMIALLVTMASVLHIIEGMLPAMPVPGARLGLANIITLTTIITFGYADALFVAIGRSLLGALFGPGLISAGFAMSLAGGILSWAVMSLAHKLGQRFFSIISLSLMGAVSHNIAQLTVASFLIAEIAIFSLFPLLMIFAVPTGIMVGLVSRYLTKALGKIPYFRS
ncbi:MAG: Gx transporter family protein [Bacillota bacterium]|jgi:heptaprenyl diphosphate synthase|nr:Gx transporter family protein [Bacillota bacterium]HOC06111.1 Gx transporter family protein [Bacillota bacterium]HPZ21581.1 Gx transporter family protein [Bacillota bacterium]HQD19478.1 Gx transporter family protein [Bacillota bacterium]